jgi:hypothetical protein
VGKPGFVVTYSSHRALEADHAAYMSHGGMLVACQEAEAPDQNQQITVRLVVGRKSFDLSARAGHFIKNRGVMVSFEDDGVEQQNALDEWLLTEDFKSAVRGETEASVQKPTVKRFVSSAGHAAAEDLLPSDDTEPRTLRPRGIGSQPDEPAPMPHALKPEPGAEYVVYVVKFSTVAEYVEHIPIFDKEALFPVPIEDPEAAVNTACQLRLTLPGHSVFNIWSLIEKIDAKTVWCRCEENDDAYRRAVLHPTTVHSKARLARETPGEREGVKVIRLVEHMPEEDEDRMPIRRRLARMGMDDKINLALSGDREERMALAMDSNKAIHHYLLKNARITLDEIAFMARLPSLNPDVLERIAEIPAFVQNPTIAKALVYNPRTPVLTAIRLLDRLPRAEVMNLAKRTNMNMRLVMAAKKRLEKRST